MMLHLCVLRSGFPAWQPCSCATVLGVIARILSHLSQTRQLAERFTSINSPANCIKQPKSRSGENMTYPMVQLQVELTKRPSPQAQLEIGKAFFGDQFPKYQRDTISHYFGYYDEEIEKLRFGQNEQEWAAAKLAATNHEHIVSIAKVIQDKTKQTHTKKALRAELKRTIFNQHDDIAIDRSIDLALRLCIMVNTREERFRSQRSRTPPLQWDENDTLPQFFDKMFPETRWKADARERHLSPHFTVAYMTRVCGLEVEWTTSLEDHLRLDREKKSLRVFPYKACLEAHLQSQSE
jgi:hypothetical protein